MTLDAEALLLALRDIRPEERQRKADATRWRQAPMQPAERMEFVQQHPEYGGSRG